ncbi:hypothetical protein GO986_14450 [Deinococcus sp. HMF7620]|uniref:Uncharacterized protein n=1 Tax=Deinococcus arboris TaxID=2682977 RepID=A0A7C9LNB2_9DEIO|nr:hypothetical protein [Deinococcus arboris]MVN87957.1 hypothetical protein [Deinococcus arboris]
MQAVSFARYGEDMSSAPRFKLSIQQVNTLNRSGLAAYVQRPPKDRVGWVSVRQVWLPEWRPAKWAYEVQHLEVTLDSFWTLKVYEEQQLDIEPWDLLMLSAFSSFLSDDLGEVERFFALFIDRPEFARHPDRVDCPHEFANEEWSRETPAHYSLIRRAWVAFLLCARDRVMEMNWLTPQQILRGHVTRVGLGDFDLLTTEGLRTVAFGQRYEAQVWAVDAEGGIQQWQEPSKRLGLSAQRLPIWSHEAESWDWPLEEGH